MNGHRLDPAEVWALLEQRRIQLVDLRGRDETGLPQVPGARWIPLDELPSELTNLDPERPLVLLSGSGHSAAEAMSVLRSAGVGASVVDGGMRAWLDAGLPTDEETPA
jgi:rhodanese-related sulfurtransferase